MILEAAALCLAMNMYHEARGDGAEGMMAVAEVTLNRVEDPRFPDNVCDVVHQGPMNGAPISRYQCQFTWYCDGKSDRMRDEHWKVVATELAIDYLTGLETNITGGADHYHATWVKPDWSYEYTKTTQIGSHIFYIWE